jgi:membrane-bound lytic murein transglycosylase D
MYWIAGQVKKRNMPMELVLLPIVESAFDPHATSGANAAGIWQIIPSTGRNYGLKQTRSYDARRDVVASTTAALDMMQRLNKMFDGDWLLTVAAYNSGEGRVLKAMKANRSRGKPTDFWSLSLPQETKMYVPKMLALSDILKNSKRYGVSCQRQTKAVRWRVFASTVRLRFPACGYGRYAGQQAENLQCRR